MIRIFSLTNNDNSQREDYKYHLEHQHLTWPFLIFIILLILMHQKSFVSSLVPIIFAATLLLQFSLAIPTPFPYQAHSFNDLNIASQLLRKGVKYFKFDASLANKESCLNYSTWDGNNSCIQTSEYAEQMCCLAMRGDASSAPNFHYPFNTSAQFITLLDTFLEQYESTIEILFVAIDFQFGFYFSNSLAQKFMAELANLMNKYKKLHVTTKGDYILEYDRVCRYYSYGSTIDEQQPSRFTLFQDSQGCTPQRNRISQSRFFLQSPSMNLNDPRDFKGRYQNFNIIYTEIDRLCQSGFPNWINRNPSFPLIFWEPSNEEQIQSSLRKLMSPQCQRKHNRSLNGIALASNIDPQMFQIAMKETGNGLFQNQFPWPFKQKKLWLQNVTSVKMAKILSQQRELLILYRKFQAFNQTQNHLTLLSINSSTNVMVIEKEVQIHEEALEIRGMQDRFILVTRKNKETSSHRQFEAVLIAYNLRLQPIALVPVNNFITSFTTKEDFFFISLSSNPQVFITYRSQSSLSKIEQYKLPVFLKEAQMQSITSMYVKPASNIGQQIYLLLGDNQDKTWIAQIKNSDEHSIKNLSFGTKSRITQRLNGQLILLFENSYSHGGLLINNNGQNKCIYHQSQGFRNLATIPYLVDGLKTSLQDLVSFIVDQSQDVTDNSKQIVTACHPNMVFSKYFNGAGVQIQSIWGQTIFSTQRIPINQQSFISTLFSGGSNFEAGLKNKKGFLITSLAPQASFISSPQPLITDS